MYYEILAQKKLVGSLEFSKSTLENHCRTIGLLINADKAARVDLLRTEVRLADIAQRLARERNTLGLQFRQLADLMGLDENDISFGLSDSLAATMPQTATEEELTAFAYEKRRDYLALIRELEACDRRVEAARSGYFPSLNLFCSYGGRWAPAPKERPAGASVFEDAGRIGLEAEVPLFDGGRIRSLVREEQARRAAAEQMVREKKMKIRLDIQTALANASSAHERMTTTGKAIDQALEGLRIEREKYGLGMGAILDVLDAQAALLEVETNYYLALADFNTALSQINFAAGKE
ncbi:MAG: TolC family protein [Spirochaetales bacterium]|nr:MAG: TolC family protein [Spirochaetales bacterium]